MNTRKKWADEILRVSSDRTALVIEKDRLIAWLGTMITNAHMREAKRLWVRFGQRGEINNQKLLMSVRDNGKSYAESRLAPWLSSEFDFNTLKSQMEAMASVHYFLVFG